MNSPDEPPEGQEPEIRPPDEPRTEPYSIPASQEKTRAVLAKSLILLFAATIGASFLYSFVITFIPRPITCFSQAGNASSIPSPAEGEGTPPAEGTSVTTNPALCSFDNGSQELITLILSSITTILGTALGFYFGTQTKDDNK